MKHGVSISETNDKPLSLTWSREDPVEWSLRVSVTVSRAGDALVSAFCL